MIISRTYFRAPFCSRNAGKSWHNEKKHFPWMFPRRQRIKEIRRDEFSSIEFSWPWRRNELCNYNGKFEACTRGFPRRYLFNYIALQFNSAGLMNSLRPLLPPNRKSISKLGSINVFRYRPTSFTNGREKMKQDSWAIAIRSTETGIYKTLFCTIVRVDYNFSFLLRYVVILYPDGNWQRINYFHWNVAFLNF